MPMSTDTYNRIIREMHAQDMSTDVEIKLTETEKGRYSIRYVPVYEANIEVHFNEYLTDDKQGQCSAFYAEKFNTEDAVKIFNTKTYGTGTFTYRMKVPQEGSKIMFVAVGFEVAQYTKVETIIKPGDNLVFLIADKETIYHCSDEDDSDTFIDEYKTVQRYASFMPLNPFSTEDEPTPEDEVDTTMKQEDTMNTRFDAILEANRKEKASKTKS